MLKLRHEWHTTISVWAVRNLRRARWWQLFRRKRNHRRNLEENREHWLVSVWMTGFWEEISSLWFCAKFELYFSWFKCEMYITTSWMAKMLTLKSNYNLCQSRQCSYDVEASVFSPSRLLVHPQWRPSSNLGISGMFHDYNFLGLLF